MIYNELTNNRVSVSKMAKYLQVHTQTIKKLKRAGENGMKFADTFGRYKS